MSRMTNTGLPVPADPALGPSIQSGWLVFAGLIVLWAGLWNIGQGALAFFRSDLFANHSVGGPLWVWSILLILFGVLQVVASGAIMSHRSWGRWFGIVTVGLAMSVEPADHRYLWLVVDRPHSGRDPGALRPHRQVAEPTPRHGVTDRTRPTCASRRISG